jgi:hypothetical protein
MDSIYTDDLSNNLTTPTYPANFDFVDMDCKIIGDYLKDTVNAVFYEANNNANIINTVHYFNRTIIPVSEFPVLKVYKDSYAEFAQEAAPLSTKFTIEYILAYAQVPKIANVGVFVADELRRALKNVDQFQIDWSNGGISVEFNTVIGNDSLIYSYTTVSCNIFTM